MIRTQSSVQVMHQRDIGWVIQRRAFRDQAHLSKDALCALVPLLSQKDLMTLLIQRKVPGLSNALTRTWISLPLLANESRNSFVDGQVHCGVVLRLTTNDQRGTRFIDKDGIHLVHDGVIQPTLHTITYLMHHIVAKVVKSVLIVGAICNVRTVCCLFFLT